MKGRGLPLPRPFRAGAPLAACAVVFAALVAAGAVAARTGLALAALSVAAGTLRSALAARELARLRRQADRELRRGHTHLLSALAEWRAAELTAPRRRRSLARSLRHTVRDLSPTRLPGPAPLNRVAVRPHAELLLQLAERIGSLDRPVTARGMLLVQELLTSPDSPLYDRDSAAQVGRSIHVCLEALDGAPDGFLHAVAG